MSRSIVTKWMPMVLASALVMSLLWASPAYAAALEVTTTTDELTDNSVCSLREAITNANTGLTSYDECGAPEASGADTINLGIAGSYTLSLAGRLEDAAQSGDLDITSDLTIARTASTGPTTYVSAGTTGGAGGDGIDRVFHIMNSASLTLQDISVRRGRPNGTGGNPELGGGILADPGSLSMSNGFVLDNATGVGAGGGIYVNGGLALTDVAVAENQGVQGGGIYKTGSAAMTISGLSAVNINKSVGGQGGGIYLAGGSATLTDADMDLNTTDNAPGGAIYHCSPGTLTLESGSELESNTAGDGYSGGGLETCATAGATTIDETSFRANSGGMGGGISFASASMDITRSYFFQNEATQTHGGAINANGSGTPLLGVESTGFDQNTAASHGGGIFNGEFLTTSIENSSFSNNTANAGGAISNGGTTTLSFSTLSANTAATGANVNDFDPVSEPSTTNIEASILGNPVTGTSCNGTITSLGDNVVESPGTCNFNGPRDEFGDPALTSFNFHGGPTPGFGLLSQSPALDSYGGSNCPGEDQRGYSRPIDGPDEDTAAVCDIGAYEAIVVSIDDQTVGEGDPPETPDMVFELTLSGAAPEAFNVSVDFLHVSTDDPDIYSCDPVTTGFCDSTITFTPGQLSKTITIEVTGDTFDEPDETFFLSLGTANAIIDHSPVIGTILDDDDTISHLRGISLNLRRHLKASGKVTVTDSFNACRKGVPVQVQRKNAAGRWKTLETIATNNKGVYKTALADKQGSYRAIAPKDIRITGSGTHSCERKTSSVKKHKH